jgi:uncharacterized zinc-type alcohol dehydrogenase-like protein
LILLWDAMIGALAPNGRLHVVGAVLEPIPVATFSLIVGQRNISGSHCQIGSTLDNVRVSGDALESERQLTYR